MASIPRPTAPIADMVGGRILVNREWFDYFRLRAESGDLAEINKELADLRRQIDDIDTSSSGSIKGTQNIRVSGQLSDGVVVIDLEALEDAGGGALQKTLRDDYGRVAGSSNATTTDLPEGDNLYYTDDRSDARAVLAVDAHVDEVDPHPQYTTAVEAAAAAPVQSVNAKTGAVELAHDDLSELQGGTSGEYYHLTNAQLARIPPVSGASSQFLRGDGVWSNTLNGSFEATGDMLTAHSFIGSDVYLGMAARAVGGIVAIRPNGPANAAGQFYVDSAGNMIPGGPCYPTEDGSFPIGQTFARWTTVYALTGTINTSDAREKTPVRPFTPAELAAAAELGREIGVYQWLAMITQKGDAARQHIGQTVQRAIAILESHGLDPFAYGFICYDEWGPKEPVVTDSGMEVSPGVQGGSRYSFRMDELLAFIARGMAHRLDAVEQRLAAAGL